MSTVTGREALNLRVLRVEVAEGLRAIVREPVALFFSVLMPVAMFAMFASLFGAGTAPEGIPWAARMLATYGTFGVVSVMLISPGMAVADDRTRGWLRVKKVSAAPIGTTIAAKVIAALPYALASLLAISAVSVALAGPVVEPGAWLRLVGVLLVGSLPFALLGLAIGFVTSSNAAAAVLNAVFFPMVIASGLWFPLDMLPGFVQAVAPFLPTYHLSRLALAQLTGAPALGHLLALLIMTAVGGGLAAWAYRNLRV
ncbi:ABC transporter permease [Pseudonocardia nigra]|uniref:ABC transporter permease n=1 Tax=Pseudonocardia nigra TaxID=1921578 RepID=UPI001C5F2B90|nr:ABC transporter permease [Pseudonocardia nigra]